MPPEQLNTEDGELGAARGVAELLIGALAGSTVLPFIEAIVSNAGQDVYDKIRGRLSRRGRTQVEREIHEGGTVTLVAEDARVVLQMPANLGANDAARLGRLRAPSDRSGWYMVYWDEAQGVWVVTAHFGPVTGTKTVDEDLGGQGHDGVAE